MVDGGAKALMALAQSRFDMTRAQVSNVQS